MAQALVQVDRVSRLFEGDGGPLVALRRVRLEIHSGQWHALWGGAGSGKSTLLLLLAGLDRPTRGSVHMAGQDLACLGEEELATLRAEHIALVFETANVVPDLTIRHNVELPLLVRRLSRRERRRRALAALARLGLEDRQSHLAADLDGGTGKCIALARAIATGASLLLVDEPTASLDGLPARRMLELLRLVHRILRPAIVTFSRERLPSPALANIHRLENGRLTSPRITPTEGSTT